MLLILSRLSGLYLHSTMYLLKRVCQGKSVKIDTHLHSTMYLLKLEQGQEAQDAAIFTFHHVSIKTVVGRCLHPVQKDLHSTMYLLKLQRLKW